MGIASIFIRTAQYLLGHEKLSGTNTLLSNSTVLQGPGTTILGAEVMDAPPAHNTAGLVVRVAGGVTPYKYVSDANTNAANVKASAGVLDFLYIFNKSTNIVYLKLYDKASIPAVTNDASVQLYPIPANASGSGEPISMFPGMKFTLGIGHAITLGAADNDTTATAAGDVVLNLGYA